MSGMVCSTENVESGGPADNNSPMLRSGSGEKLLSSPAVVDQGTRLVGYCSGRYPQVRANSENGNGDGDGNTWLKALGWAGAVSR